MENTVLDLLEEPIFNLQVVDKLLKRYKEGVKSIESTQSSDMFAIRSILENRFLENGVCYCCMNMFGYNPFYDDQVQRFVQHENNYWCRVPKYCNTKVEVLSSLQIRINNLEIIWNDLTRNISQE